MRKHVLSLSAVVGLAVAACNGTTGDEIIEFPAYASGASGAGEPFSANGYTVKLTLAQMYIGAVYLNEAPPAAWFDTPLCTNPGIYAAQVPGGVDVNLLSTAPQPFSVKGSGTADQGLSWELYLTDGDVNNPNNGGFGVPNSVDLQGTATRQSDGAVFNWAATVNINQQNRGLPVNDPSQPGLSPICKQRIVALGGISLELFAGGSLLVTVDPRGWLELAKIDFSSLPSVNTDQCEIDGQSSIYPEDPHELCIPDSSNLSGGTPGSQQGSSLYSAIYTAGPAAYALSYAASQ